MSHENIQNNKTAARQRSNIYGLLAAVYRQEVNADLLQQIKDPRFKGVFSDLGSVEMNAYFQKPEEEILEKLAVEYARLFLGPGKHVSPHESVHHRRDDGQWGSLWGKSTVEVKKLIESTGLYYKDTYKGMPDHISVELEFMQQVILREEKAWEEADTETAYDCRRLEKKFIEEHLFRWIPIFCDKVIREAELSFYREMAALTKNFIEFEKDEINRYGDGFSWFSSTLCPTLIF